LERSKEAVAKGHETPKAQITVLGETIKWDDLANVLTDSKRLVNWLEQGIVNHLSFTAYRPMERCSSNFMTRITPQACGLYLFLHMTFSAISKKKGKRSHEMGIRTHARLTGISHS